MALDTNITVALISAIVALVTTILAHLGQVMLVKSKSKTKADEVVSKYKDPLIIAAFELQSKLYNILNKYFLEAFYSKGNKRERDYALNNSLYVICQFFAWREIINKEIRFLDLGAVKSTAKLSSMLERIRLLFLKDKYGQGLIVYRGEQHALGERMIKLENGKSSCMGYAEFIDSKKSLQPWIGYLERDLLDLTKKKKKDNVRLVKIQHALVDILEYLDPHGIRVPNNYRKKYQEKKE